MKAISEESMLIVAGITILLILVIGIGLPLVLKQIGLAQWSDVLEKMQNLERYKEPVQVRLTSTIDSIEFLNENKNTLCEGRKGKSFILIKVGKKPKTSTLGVLWKTIMHGVDSGISESVKGFIKTTCIPKDYTINLIDGPNPLEGPRENDEVRIYSISTDKILVARSYNIHIKEIRNGGN